MDIMGIARLSMNMSEVNVMREVNMALMRNALDHAEQTGEMLSGLMADLPTPPVGFDGLGIHIDMYI